MARESNALTNGFRHLLPRGKFAGAALVVIAINLVAWLLIPNMHGMTLGRAAFWVYTFLYACRRAIAFHPLMDSAYFGWLRLTPWRSDKPLPLGSVALAWPDFVILGTLSAAYFIGNPAFWPGAPLLVFSAVSSLIYILILSRIGWWLVGYAGLIALGGVVMLWPYVNLMLALALVIFAAMSWCITRSLREYPWFQERPIGIFAGHAGHYRLLGPPEDPGTSNHLHRAIWAAILTAWWVYAVTSRIGTRVILCIIVYIAVLAVCLILYMRTYLVGKSAPISFIGRIFTGRWIIPGYDRIYVPLLLGQTIGIVLPFVFTRLGLPLPQAETLSILAVIVALASGPSLRKWTLTGHYRIPMPGHKRRPLDGDAKDALRTLSYGGGIERTWLRVIPNSAVYFAGVWFVLPIAFWLDATTGSFLAGIIIILQSLHYGAMRVRNFHPVHAPAYMEWLKRMPWHAGKPLPFGPVQPVWQDLVPVAVLTAEAAIAWWFLRHGMRIPARYASLAPLLLTLPAALVTFRYSFSAMRTLASIGRVGTAFVICCLLAVPLLRWDAVWNLPLLAGTALFAGAGLRASLNDFPWAGTWFVSRPQGKARDDLMKMMFVELVAREPIGPTWHYLSPRVEMMMATPRTRALICVAIGWWSFAAAQLLTEPRIPFFLYGDAVVLAVIWRIALYSMWGQPPLGVFGRLFTLHWVIWRHDKPYLITCAIGLISGALPFAIAGAGVPTAVNVGICAAASLAMFVFIGPSLRKWRLTGGHRGPVGNHYKYTAIDQ